MRAIIVSTILLFGLVVGLAPSTTGQITERLSVDSSGLEGNGISGRVSISWSGRFVAFWSQADNLVAGDANGVGDIFVHDRLTATTTRVSVDSNGLESNDRSVSASISGSGRFVAFDSYASNLVPNDTNGERDVFVYDLQTKVTTRASVASDGSEGFRESTAAAMSGDGRFVSYLSFASNLVDNDTNRVPDIFVHDLSTLRTTRVSVSSSGAQGNDLSIYSSMSGDGRFVAFSSFAGTLVPGDTNGTRDVFVHDRLTGSTSRVSVDSSLNQGNGDGSDNPSISADGTRVAFWSFDSNLVLGDTNGKKDIFMHDTLTGQTTRVNVDSLGTQGDDAASYPSISADGQFIAFASNATNLVSGDTNGESDVFRHDTVTGLTNRVSVSSVGTEGNGGSGGPSVSSDGRLVGFTSGASNLVSGDTNLSSDVFVHGRQLTLDVNPCCGVVSGDTVTFFTWRGSPGSPAGLVATEINGAPTTIILAMGVFDAQGTFTLGPVQVPSGIGSFSITLQSLGALPRIETTNDVTLQVN